MQPKNLNIISTKLDQLKKFILKKDIYISIVIAASLILVGLFLGWHNNKVVPMSTNPIATYKSEPGNPLSFMSNWDGVDYIHLAKQGYTDVSQANFFPLYPSLIHILNYVISSPLDCALLISWVSLVGVIYFYLKIIGELFKDKGMKAVRASLLLLLFPTAVFFLATYTESLFALLALGSIYFTLKKQYFYAALLALPMTATHITAVFVLALIALIMWEEKAKLTEMISVLVTGSLGLVAYMIFLQEKFHKPLSFVTSQENHGWLSHHYAGISSVDVYNVLFIVLIILAAIYWWKRRLSLAIYSLIFLLIPIIGQQFGGFNRYVLIAFPIPLMLYGISKKRPNLYIAIIILTSLSWTYFMLQYAGGYVGG